MLENTILEDNRFTSDELATLNQEVTPEIQKVLEQTLISNALADLPKEPVYIYGGIDVDDLAQVIEFQLRMSNGMRLIEEISATLKDAKEGKIERIPYGEWKVLNARLARLWDHWKMLKDQCSSVVKGDKYLWVKYFAVEDLEKWLAEYNESYEGINTYFTSGNVEDVDDFRLLASTLNERMDDLRDNYLLEKAEYTNPESSGNGFWRNTNNSPVYDITNFVLLQQEKEVKINEDQELFAQQQDAFIDQRLAAEAGEKE